MKEETIKTLYYTTNQYNQVKILNYLFNIIKENGGFLVNSFPFINTYIKTKYFNRSIKNLIIDNEKWLEVPKKEHYNNLTKEQKERVQNNIKEYKQAKKIENNFITSYFTTYLHFYYNDFIYYIQFNENSFFPYYVSKQFTEKTITDDFITRYDCYMQEMDETIKDSILDIIYDPFIKEEELQQKANELFNYLINLQHDEIITKKIRVNNSRYTNDGWHYEYKKEEKIKKYKRMELN